MPNKRSEPNKELNRLMSDGIGYGDEQARLTDERRFQILQKAYETAIDTRKLKIELFWKRSLFFWGFIATAFAAYFTLESSGSNFSFLIACFGLICSIVWSLSNRGSKYWQESWEEKVERIEPDITGELFSEEEPVQKKGFWLRSRKFSVSKLTIALSDYTFMIWLGIISWEVLSLMNIEIPEIVYDTYMPISFMLMTILFGFSLLFFGKSSDRSHEKEKDH